MPGFNNSSVFSISAKILHVWLAGSTTESTKVIRPGNLLRSTERSAPSIWGIK